MSILDAMARADEIKPISPFGLTLEAYQSLCKAQEVGRGRAQTAYEAIYRDGATESAPAKIVVPAIVTRHEEVVKEGVTIKFVQRLPNPEHRLKDRGIDFDDIESVIIPMIGRSGRKTHTLCVSSQVGCAMGCDFCETAQMGLIRSLRAEEIVAQWWAARFIEGIQIDNIVFMGMGEPMDNLDEVLKAIDCLTDRNGPCIPMSGITISTVGRVDGLERIKEQVQKPGWKRLGLALSLNASNDRVRSELMPVNKKWNMQRLQDVLLELREVRGGRKIMIEYVLIPGVNCDDEHADELAEWMKPFLKDPTRDKGKGHGGLLNVIPYNPRRDSPWEAPSDEVVDRFVNRLVGHGVFVNCRRTKGRDTMAACGQLGTAEIRKRKYVQMKTSASEDQSTAHG
ncbi:MAG: 23S rRNA (adenine(2503)-C(2))-methyltransferase RlmN [Phycisphaerales bacterium]|nr:23S rRNA (adenine(2503)-C(2))-methyltransferase RlmN [Phycisphaerales bacterium]